MAVVDKLLSLLLLTFLAQVCVLVASDRKLLQTNLVYRHGDRAPISVYPLDKHQADAWPSGLGELTQKGKEQQTGLGRFLKSRYDKLLDSKFDSKQIYVRSSDMDRTLMSAYSNLAGLYSDSDEPLWNGYFVKWQPIPVHTVPAESDQLLKMERKCAVVDDYLDQYWKSETVEKLRQDLSSFIRLVTDKTGLAGASLWSIEGVRDTLFCESQHNMALPDWAKFKNITCGDENEPSIVCANRTVFQILTDLQNLLFTLKYSSDLVQKFMGGPLLLDMIGNMKSMVNGDESAIGFHMYSAHDSTVSALLSAIGVFNGKLPPYTATLMLDLYQEGDNYQVEISYKNKTGSDKLVPLTVPGCGEDACQFTTFSGLYTDKYNIPNWDEACQNKPQSPHKVIFTEEEIIVISVCLVIVVTTILLALICYIKSRRNNQPNADYRLVPT